MKLSRPLTRLVLELTLLRALLRGVESRHALHHVLVALVAMTMALAMGVVHLVLLRSNLGRQRRQVHVSELTELATVGEESIERRSELVRRVGDVVAAVPRNTLDVRQGRHPLDGVASKLRNLLLGRVRVGGDTKLSHPDRKVVTRVDLTNPLLQEVKVLVRAVPVESHEAHLAATSLALVHELLDPVQVPHHLGRADVLALLRVGLELLHPEFNRRLGVQVSLSGDVGLVECQDVRRVVLGDLALAQLPLGVLLRTPEGRHVLSVLGHLSDVALLPVVVPRNHTGRDLLRPAVVGPPRNTELRLGRNRLGAKDGNSRRSDSDSRQELHLEKCFLRRKTSSA